MSPSAAAAVFASRAGNPDTQRAGDEFQQRPAAGLVELVQPARELFWQLGLAERAKGGDDLAEGRGRRVVVSARWEALSSTPPPETPSLDPPRIRLPLRSYGGQEGEGV